MYDSVKVLLTHSVWQCSKHYNACMSALLFLFQIIWKLLDDSVWILDRVVSHLYEGRFKSNVSYDAGP